MKTTIHPNYYVTKVSCACGNAFVTRSTRKEIKLDICYACHPFYTGKQRMLDTAGNVERFKKRFAKTEGKTVQRRPSAQVPMKKLDLQTSTKTKKKVLSTAPDAKPKDGAKEKKAPAKKA